MTTLLQRMHDELVRRNYAATTIRTYLHALRTCERYHRGRRRVDELELVAHRSVRSDFPIRVAALHQQATRGPGLHEIGRL